MIDYRVSDEEQAVIDAARQVAASSDPWAGLVDGGWLDLLVEEPKAGLGYLGLVAEELGAQGVAVPLSVTAGAWPTYFNKSADGRKVGFVTEGLCEFGVGADVVLVPAGEGGGVAAYETFEVEPVGSLEGDGLARVTVQGEPVDTCTDEAARSLAVCRSIALVCAEMAGLFRRIEEMTLEHLKTREQFGRPLASFQVIQHEGARLATLAEAAIWGARLTTHEPEADNVHAVKGWMSAASQQVAAMAHQLHAAIGFTQEYGLQRLTKRLRTLRFTFGDDTEHHTALGRRRATTPA